MKRRQYQVIQCSAWMNESGYGIHHNPIGALHPRASDAISAGLRHFGHDDFQIGVVEDARLIELRWMDEVIDETPETLAEIAEEIGHQPAIRR